jgi:hypothetical protein
VEKYAPNVLRRIEEQRDGLRSGTGGAPSNFIALRVRAQRIFYRERWVF